MAGWARTLLGKLAGGAAGVAACGAAAGMQQRLCVSCEEGRPQAAHWDADWDCRADREQSNVTRHLVLVRHGQYVEGGKEDATMVLTALGRRQAELTGRRLASYLPEGATWKVIHQSNMVRAKETAEIIAAQLPAGIPITAPNALLNEGFPADPVPRPRSMWKREDTWRDGPRIEAAYRLLFHRAITDTEDSARGDPRLVSSAQTGQAPGAEAAAARGTPTTRKARLTSCGATMLHH